MYNFQKIAVLVVLCMTFLTNQSSAETRFCIGGDLDQLSAAQRKSCLTKMNQVRTAAAKDKAPSDWHFVVVCTDSGWSDYASFSKRSAAELNEASADTDLDQRTTYFRADSLLSGPHGNLERLVTDEVASIKLKNTDKASQRNASRWAPMAAKHAPALDGLHPTAATEQAGS